VRVGRIQNAISVTVSTASAISAISAHQPPGKMALAPLISLARNRVIAARIRCGSGGW
jgi:hypothetical protein